MDTPPLLMFTGMAAQTNLARRCGEHADIVTAMNRMARLAIALLNRFMLGSGLDLGMTGEADPALHFFQSDASTRDLMTFVAVTALHGCVDHLLEQPLLIRGVLRMTVETMGADGIILMGCTEFAGIRLMARRA